MSSYLPPISIDHRSIEFPVCTYYFRLFQLLVAHVCVVDVAVESSGETKTAIHAALDQEYTDTAVGAHRIFTIASRT
jgi:hypothetical protein